MRRPTRNDVARLAGVSGCTVSYVLNGRTDVSISEATRARVLAAAKELGYQPNHAARALVTGSTNTISIWVGSFASYYAHMVNHLQQQIMGNGYRVLIEYVDNHPDPQVQPVSSVDGIIAVDWPEYASAFLNSHPELSTPVVSVGDFHLENTDYVGVDLFRASCEAVEHLIEVGCKRIAYMDPGGPDRRRDAYDRTVAHGGLDHVLVQVPEYSRSGARHAMRAHVREHGCPDGIFCHNDDLAIGAYRGLCDLGIRVPDDVAIVGCDGIEDIEYLECPLTTIKQPVEEMCALAWDYLQVRMADPATPLQQSILSPSLLLRESTRRVTQRTG